MSFLEGLQGALFSLRTNKLRTGLTMLGIIIGIAAVIAVVTIGLGGKAAIMLEMEKSGTNLFILYSKSVGQTDQSSFIGLVAGISLLVGGIGIMNIMLVSVTERTREIGLRKAVGAKERDILVQFLLEAIVLSLIGGIVGIALGVGSAQLVAYLLHWPPLLSGWAILSAVSFSIGVGLFFGYYPAMKAAKLEPMTALRYE